jgi:hypothetical protein
VASTVLQSTTLQLSLADIGIKYAEGPVVKPKHDSAYWARVTRGFDLSDADRVPPALYNEVLWKGMMSDKPFPVLHTQFKTTLPERMSLPQGAVARLAGAVMASFRGIKNFSRRRNPYVGPELPCHH